jgi:prepilin-type N-terminal cleavage/methylation domain-containing protein
MRAHTVKLGARPGFSLVEMIISMSIGSMLIAAFFGTVTNMQRQYRIQRDTRMAEDGMRTAEQVLRTVLQGAAADPLGKGLSGLEPGTLTGGMGSEIRIKSDFNPADGDIADALEDVTVKVVSDSLMVRWTGTGSFESLVYPVRSITFEYFDEGLNPVTTTAGAASAIAVRFTISAPENPMSSTLRSRQTWVYLQNRR